MQRQLLPAAWRALAWGAQGAGLIAVDAAAVCPTNGHCRCFASQEALPDLERWAPGLKPLSQVPNLADYNDELAEACARDRATARLRLFNDLPALLKRQALHAESLNMQMLQHLQVNDVRSLLRPCVGDPALLDGPVDLLRTRLLAILQYTALQGAVPIDLYDRADMALMNDHYARAAKSGEVAVPKPPQPSQPAPQRERPKPRTVQECMRQMLHSEGGPTVEAALMSAEQIADLLVEARLEDAAIIDLRCFEGQRIADSLVLASGRSAQHAYAGAKAVQYHLKELQKQAGQPAAVALGGSLEGGWFFLRSGGVSVHCFDRDTRAEANLEDLWGGHSNLRWWRAGERSLTLDNITVE